METGLNGGDAFDVIDVVVDLGLAAVAIAFSGVLFLNSRRRVMSADGRSATLGCGH